MSKLTEEIEYGSTSASPLPMTLSPAIKEHGSTSALREPEIQMAENTPQCQFKYDDPETAKILSIETRENYFIYGIPFYHAAINGDCSEAIKICQLQPDIVRARITSELETGLHIAAATKNLSFVTILVKTMTLDDIRMISKSKNTALCFAAASGIVDIAKVMVEKDKDLPLVKGEGGKTPLHIAAELGHKDMVNYLLKLTDVDKKLTDDEVMELFISLINTNLYKVALKILKKYPTLATSHDKRGETALHVLARKPLSSKVHLDRGNWKGFLTSGFSIDDSINSHKNNKALLLVRNLWKYAVQTLDDINLSQLIAVPTHLLFVATKSGNVEFITILIKYYPDLIWKNVDDEKRISMFHVAVYERQESIFRIIYEIGAIKNLIARQIDSKDNNMLHMAAKLAPSNRLNIVSGAALQLRRELTWFKEVEKIVLPSYRETENKDGFTPKELFVAEHKELREKGEKWMKSTAQSCMIVSTLITTVMFAAVFNLPGGRMADGTPNFLKKPWFLTFVIADSISLLCSTITIFIFLSIFTSRYKEEDFLHALPTKLIVGLLVLLGSMVMMMIAFSASMFIIFHGKSFFLAVEISCLAVFPVGYYLVHHWRLFADIFADILSSTYNSKFIFQFKTDNLEEIIVQNEEEKSKGN